MARSQCGMTADRTAARAVYHVTEKEQKKQQQQTVWSKSTKHTNTTIPRWMLAGDKADILEIHFWGLTSSTEDCTCERNVTVQCFPEFSSKVLLPMGLFVCSWGVPFVTDTLGTWFYVWHCTVYLLSKHVVKKVMRKQHQKLSIAGG